MSDHYPHNFALARINSMKERPGMWAYGEEAFVLQVALLLEFAGLDRDKVHRWLVRTGVPRAGQITQERADAICNSALEILP